ALSSAASDVYKRQEYNNAVQTFPSNIVAGMTGFQREIMFDLGKNERANLDQAPKISF
ncbi:LemA family protein, partial [Bacteroides xylanisolvens]|uniref:LemA family protein n=1 Tax=Bacteroides xylanisolvens TaxID=371601 RepID=UPI0023072AAD